jgi:hypothetical protein
MVASDASAKMKILWDYGRPGACAIALFTPGFDECRPKPYLDLCP